ncbi:MAG: tripartite tricarboxylate transporter TctB family protein [Candidatus Rokubacteria bacterium]|nr:tripartite tricarboxylate transporter TctB family protein [Candidatus Rokubacteria bacterium]
MIERVVALALLAASGVYLANGLPLPRGTAGRPGPGFFPLAVGVFAVVVALAWVALAFRRAPAAAGGTPAPADGRGRVLATAAALAGYCLLLPWIGYPAASLLFVGGLLRGLGAGWTAALAVAVASAAGSYYVFAVLLGVPLPPGALLD